MNKFIAIVDDEPDILELVSIHLKKSNFNPKGFQNAKSLIKFLKKQIPDLIILDLMLPDADGFEVCKYLKKEDSFSHIPIIMLTAKGEEIDKVLGLELGADDYVTKPFSPKELVARVKAVLRRKKQKEESQKIEISDILVIDKQKYEVFVEDKKVELTPTEFRILSFLSSKKGWIFSRDKILDYLWGDEKIILDRTVDVHINHLREKLGKAGKLIKNVRGLGYKFEE
ncbi:response regulator [candidate division WOR-3 bacterium]|nr:response regulator [candidate division WOR-3 bacterium]